MADLAAGSLILSGTFKILLLKTTAGFSKAHQFVSSISAYEIVATNYGRGFSGSGRKDITLTPSLSANGQYAQIVLSQVTWPALGGTTNDTICAAAIYKPGTSDVNSELVAFLDLDNTETNGNDFTLVPASGGNIILSS